MGRPSMDFQKWKQKFGLPAQSEYMQQAKANVWQAEQGAELMQQQMEKMF